MSRLYREVLGETHEHYDVLLSHLSVIRDLVHLANHAASFGELCTSFAECLVAGLGYERVTVIAARDGEDLTIVGGYSQAERLAGAVEPGSPTLIALARDIVEEHALVRWNGEGVGARRAMPPGLEGSIVGFPLVVGGECSGAVVCEELVPLAWDLARQRALELVGEIAGQVVTLTQVRLSMAEMQRRLEAELGVSRTRLTDQEETLRAQSARIADLTSALVASNRAKNNFLGLMSHELRTPLSVILGFGSILHDGLAGPVTTEQEQHLDRVLRNGRHLNQLVDDMLFFVDAETTRIEPQWTAVDLAALLGEVIDARPEIRREGAPALTVTIAPEAATLRTDAGLLRRVLFHLIGNAFKFTEHGAVRIEARRAAGGRATEIRIIDTGVGIAPEQRERIFELFRQGDDTHTRKREGVGLGLNLVRACLVLLRGRCQLGPAPAGGTQVEIVIPEGGEELTDPAGAPDARGAWASEAVSLAAGASSPSDRASSGRG